MAQFQVHFLSDIDIVFGDSTSFNVMLSSFAALEKTSDHKPSFEAVSSGGWDLVVLDTFFAVTGLGVAWASKAPLLAMSTTKLAAPHLARRGYPTPTHIAPPFFPLSEIPIVDMKRDAPGLGISKQLVGSIWPFRDG